MTENDLHFSDPADAQRMPLVALRRISRFFSASHHALFDMSLDIYPGEFVYLAGPSGAGKSTLLKVIHLSETPDTGNIYFSGHDVSELQARALSVLRRSIGFVFQDFKLVPYLSVAANMALPLEIAGMRPAHIRAEVTHMLSRIGLSGRGDDRAVTLSGGEQQRVAVARALIGKPDLILADEPTGSLDAYSAEFVFELLEDACVGGTAVIFATHDRMLISARPNRYVAIDRGRIIGASASEGPMASRRQRPRKDPIKHTSTSWRIA